MKRKIVVILIVTLLILTTVLLNSVSACTGFTVSEGDTTLVGANEDWWLANPYLRVQPPEGENFGYVIFEYGFPQAWDADFMRPFSGLNDQGLFFDFFYTPELKIGFNFSKPLLLEDPTIYFMEKFSTVDEVIDYLSQYNIFLLGFLGLNEAQMFVADTTGASAIIEGDDIIYKQGEFQVVTNFLQTHPELGWYPCWRYKTAVEMLENMTELSVDYFKSICQATHQEMTPSPTQYSGIYDLNNGIINLYHYHDYGNLIEINLDQEFLKGENSYFVPSLFEPNDNQPPNTPDPPLFPTFIESRTEYFFDVYETTDPDNEADEIYYKFDRGDGTETFFVNNQFLKHNNSSCSWKKPGQYDLRVKACDIYGKESDWSEPLTITVNRSDLMTMLLIGALAFIGVTGIILLIKRIINNIRERRVNPGENCV